MQIIRSLDEIKAVKSDYYVFVYKSDSEQSKCALTNLKNAAQDLENVYLADILETKDVHTSLGVKSAPTLVQIREGKMQQQIKGCQSTGFYQTLISGERFSSFASASGGNSSSSIIIYTTPTCTYCNSLKSYMNEKNISYTEIDVSKDQSAAEEMVKRSGQKGVPQTLINGQVVIGFDRTKINQLLNID